MKNDVGEALFYETLQSADFVGEVGRSLWKARGESRQRNFRRELTYFATAAAKIGLDPHLPPSYADGVRQLAAVMRHLHTVGRKKATVVHAVSSAVSTLGHYVYDRALTESHVIRDLNRSFARQTPKHKQRLQLDWEIGDLWRTIRSLPNLREREWKILVGSILCLVRGLTGLRLTELQQFDRKATRPSDDGSAWAFNIRVKGRSYTQTVVLRRGTDPALDPVAHLLEYDRRIDELQREGCEIVNSSFWVREDGSSYSYSALSTLVTNTLRTGGINERRGYHIKHAATTALVRANVPGEKITEFLRHKHGSGLYLSYYTDHSKDAECSEVLAKQ
jgi:hypothetical protein